MCVCFSLIELPFARTSVTAYDRTHSRFRRSGSLHLGNAPRRDKTTCRPIASYSCDNVSLRRFGNTLVRHAINSVWSSCRTRGYLWYLCAEHAEKRAHFRTFCRRTYSLFFFTKFPESGPGVVYHASGIVRSIENCRE